MVEEVFAQNAEKVTNIIKGIISKI